MFIVHPGDLTRWSTCIGRRLLYEEEAAAIVVSQPEGDICREVVAQAHDDCRNQGILLRPLEATKTWYQR